MDYSKINHFLTVYETESIRGAAEILFITAGALSKSIKQLEEEFSVKLFQAQGRGIIPTEEGHHFYEVLKELYLKYEDSLNKLKKVDNNSGLLRIASWEVFTSYFLPEVAKTTFPEKQLRILEREPGEIEKSILKNESDVGITYAPIPHQRLDHIRIGKIEYAIFGLAKKFSGKKLPDLPFSVPVTKFESSPTGIRTLDNWPQDIPRFIKYEFELLETALETARHGLNVVFLPKFLIQLQNRALKSGFQLDEIAPKGYKVKAVNRQIFIVKRKSFQLGDDFHKLQNSLSSL